MSFFSHHDKQHAGDTEPFNCDCDVFGFNNDGDGVDKLRVMMRTMMPLASHHGQCLSSRGRKHFFKTGKLWSLGKHCCSNPVVILTIFSYKH